MPHLRPRLALSRLKKKLKFSRVVSIQGARQTGKSVLARELLDHKVYVTLDDMSTRNEANLRPGFFLESLRQDNEEATLVIDEAQKAPALFDQIKTVVDIDKRCGQFLLLGSTEFSIEARVTESLTGRISRTRLFPLLLSECTQVLAQGPIDGFYQKKSAPFERTDFARYLKNGGFPAIFSVRDPHERQQRIDEWLRLTCERDVLQFKTMKPDPELCFRILEIIASLEEPSASALGHALKVSSKRIQTQLNALCKIFALHRLDPHPLSSGSPLYFLVDPALAAHHGADMNARMTCAYVTEFLAKQSYQAVTPCRFSFFRNSKGSRIPLLVELGPKKILAIKWLDSETVDKRELLILKSFQKRAAEQGMAVIPIAMCGVSHSTRVEGVHVVPWEMAF